MLRSAAFFGLNTFIELYWIRHLDASRALAGIALTCFLLAPGEFAPLAAALATGIALNIPFAVLVKLGQDYLPTRPGTAAGVTLGLGVSVGGLLAVPPAALLAGLALRDPELTLDTDRAQSDGRARAGSAADPG